KVTTSATMSAVMAVIRRSKLRYTTANASTSARANRAKMGKRQGTKSIQKTPNTQRPTPNSAVIASVHDQRLDVVSAQRSTTNSAGDGTYCHSERSRGISHY